MVNVPEKTAPALLTCCGSERSLQRQAACADASDTMTVVSATTTSTSRRLSMVLFDHSGRREPEHRGQYSRHAVVVVARRQVRRGLDDGGVRDRHGVRRTG